jgi:hypothetical protein
LSGSLASLKISPELSRGIITRLFSNIGSAAAGGGFEVQEFGRLTGRTADEFVADWGTEPARVLQDFFDGINAEGPRAQRTLEAIGITADRDIPSILRLAQSSDEVRRLIALSSDEYVNATKVNEQYGIISGTTAEQINRLGQNFQTLGAAVGDSVGPLSALFQFLNLLVQGLTRIVNTPVGQFFSFVAISVALLVSGITALLAVLAGTLAGFLAAQFAANKLGISLGTVIKAAFGSKTAIDALGISMNTAAVSAGRLAAGLRLAFIATGIGAVVTVITLAIAAFGNEVDETEDKVQSLFGGMEALREAIDADTAAFNESTGRMRDGSEAIMVYRREVTKTTDSLISNVDVAKDFIKNQGEIATAVDGATSSVEDQTRAISDNTVQFFAGSLTQDADIVSLLADRSVQESFIEQGVTITELIAAGIEGNADPIIDALISSQEKALSSAENRLLDIDPLSFDTDPEELERYKQLSAEIEKRELNIASLDGALRDQLSASADAIELDREYEETTREITEALAEQGIYANLSQQAISELMDELFGAVNAAERTKSAFVDLGAEFAGLEGGALDASGAIQGVIESILAGTLDPEQQIANLAQAMIILQAAGLGSAAIMTALDGAINGVALRAGIGADEVARLVNNAAILGTLDGIPEAIADGMNKVSTSAGGAASKVQTLADKFGELVDSMFESINLGRDTEDAIFALGEAFGESGDQALYASDEMQDAIGAILKQSGSAEQGVANLSALFAHLAKTAGGESAPSLQILRQAISQVGAQFGLSEAQVQQFIATAGGGLANINVNNFNLGIQNAQKEVRTLLDYASDLEQVFTRAFDIRFARTMAIDDLADAWQNFSEQVEDARYELEELQASQSDVGADRALKQYFLSIAEAYNDTLRAAQLRKEISKLDREQAENARKLEEAQAIAGGDLTGQGAGQRQNRQALLGLVQNYQSYITALAESGASQKELKTATAAARQEFIQQALELGFQETVVLEYAKAFDDVQTAISKVERNITVDANVNPALQALNELNASLNKNIEAARTLNAELGKKPATKPATSATTTGASVRPPLLPSGQVNRPVGNIIFGSGARVTIRDTRFEGNTGGFFSSGGFTGRGGKYDPAGIVHKGEYVIPQQFVNQSTGLPDMAFLTQLQNGARNFTAGGFMAPSAAATSTGPTMVELSPYDRKLLADAGNVQLRLNGKIVAEATNRANLIDAQRGTN